MSPPTPRSRSGSQVWAHFTAPCGDRVARPTCPRSSSPGPTGEAGSFTDGAFAFPRLDPGDYTIDVSSTDGTGSAKARVSSADAASVDIVLIPNGTVTGRVVDKTGTPIAGLGVALLPDQAPGQLRIDLHEPPPSSAPDGRFQVQGPPGTRTLVVLGRKPTAKRGIAVTSDKTLDVGDVTVEP